MTPKEAGNILNFIGLDTKIYDFEAAQKLPIRGSSLYRGSKEKVRWDPLEKTPDFKIIKRK